LKCTTLRGSSALALAQTRKKIRLHIVEQAAEQGLNLVYKRRDYFEKLVMISFGRYFVLAAHRSLLSLVLGFGSDSVMAL